MHSKHFRKSREANVFCADMNGKLNRHEFTPTETIAFAKLCEEWLEIKEPGLRPETMRNYRDQIRLRLIPEFGLYLVTGIAPRDVERYAARLAKSGLAPETQRKTLMTLKAILEKAVQWGYLGKNPAVFAKAPKRTKKDVEVLSPAEMALLI
ncbi:MAG: phage integrase SAM-like domain-containing protein, partial [Actinomycetota bacterium]|nr:phage integrase SAM-like domain-containing protein [Actinomycetota bacterium]